MGFSLSHLLAVVVIVLILFGGRGKISAIMGDFAMGIKSFKKGMADDPTPEEQETPVQAASLKVAEKQPVLQYVEEVEVQVKAPTRSKPKTAARSTSKATNAKPSTAKAATTKAPTTKKVAASKSSGTKSASAKPAASRKKETT